MHRGQGVVRGEFRSAMWRIFCYGISVVSIAGLQYDRGVSLRLLLVGLFFACIFAVLAVCIELLLSRENDAPGSFLDAVRPAVFVQFFVLGLASINLSDLLTPPASYGKAVFVLLLYVAVAAPSLLIMRATLRMLAFEKSRESSPFTEG
ncbi:MAG TPA: hypothetical protein PLO62_01655 [Candidatus Hydrogenedentes bacterium]|nr:hypothetical protein [Candidatus Hydrogenedentota bacterium]